MLKKLAITVSEATARWVRRKVAAENTSVAELVERLLEDRMRQTSEYRLSRKEANARR